MGYKNLFHVPPQDGELPENQDEPEMLGFDWASEGASAEEVKKSPTHGLMTIAKGPMDESFFEPDTLVRIYIPVSAFAQEGMGSVVHEILSVAAINLRANWERLREASKGERLKKESGFTLKLPGKELRDFYDRQESEDDEPLNWKGENDDDE